MSDAVCSFCGKMQHEVVIIIVGGAGCICGECVAICLGIMAQRAADLAAILPMPARQSDKTAEE